MTVKYS